MATVTEERTTPFATIEEAIDEIRRGRLVVVVDAPDRENEGDLTIAADFATPEAVNFMATYGRGVICLCLTEERSDTSCRSALGRAACSSARARPRPQSTSQGSPASPRPESSAR